MSAQEQRQEIVTANIPKLLSKLTGLEENEDSLKACEQFAWHIIKNHKTLSINSHEVKRKIEGMKEKFILENYEEQANLLQKFCDRIINHPICQNHYELDIQWSILDFLISVAYNPVGNLRKNKSEALRFMIEEDDDISCSDNDTTYWASILREDHFPLEQSDNDGSELSIWSSCNSMNGENTNRERNDDGENSLFDSRSETEIGASPENMLVRSPQKEDHYKRFECDDAQGKLLEKIQNTWWTDKTVNCQVNSGFLAANFCLFWNQQMAESSNNLIKPRQISTVPEYCLLREIIWAFKEPSNCKFFAIEKGEIQLRENVSLPSATVDGLKMFLECILPYMKMSNVMIKFIDSIYYYVGKAPPRTYEHYAPALQDMLQPFYESLFKMENRIKNQTSMEICTIIQFKRQFEDMFQYLEQVYNIHNSVILDYEKYHAHICSAHLLSGLLLNYRLGSSSQISNVAAALFLCSVKPFCDIIDVWWTEGRLDDWRNEFLIEKPSVDMDEFLPRLFKKCREKSFFVPTNVSTVIEHNSFLKLLLDHSMKASFTLNLLYRLNKIGNLKYASNFEGNLYDILLESVFNSIDNFKYETTKGDNDAEEDNLSYKDSSEDFVSSFSTSIDDALLLLAFGCSADSKKEQGDNNFGEETETGKEVAQKPEKSRPSALKIFKKFNEMSKIILPIEEIILNSMEEILQARISFANSFVIVLFRDEYGLLKELQNIRRVLLLEADDLMHTYYTKLFSDIETGKQWRNSLALTERLGDILCAKYPDMPSLIRIEIESGIQTHTTKVVEAVDGLRVSYNIKKELQYVITDENIGEYNKIFRFLLKVKWGLWALENLSFPRYHKKKPPYAPFTIRDFFMRRLEQLRFWLLFALQCIHSHLMTYVLQLMAKQLEERIDNSFSLLEIKSVHESYINAVAEHCFVKDCNPDIKVAVEQLLNLVQVLKIEWNCTLAYVENHDLEIEGDIENEIQALEHTYIRCHQYLAKILNSEVYAKKNPYLTGLSAAFNTSLPY